MKIGPFVFGKDGGADSTVDGVMFEIESLFTIGFLRFHPGSRDAYHSHAFNCRSWLLKGRLVEEFLDNTRGFFIHRAGSCIDTFRTDIHQVSSDGTSYVFTIRGPWKRTWVDVSFQYGTWWVDILCHGRGVVRAETFARRQDAAAFAIAQAGAR